MFEFGQLSLCNKYLYNKTTYLTTQFESIQQVLMTLELSDDQVLQISKVLYNQFKTEETQKLLDQDHLDTFKRKYIKPLFPHKYFNDQGERKIQKYSCKQICCELHPGSFCCCSSSPPDKVYTEFGLGVNLYFKFMKHFSCFFFFLAIMSLVSMALCYWVAIQTDINPISDYHTFFFSGTMGVLSADHIQCKYSNYDSLTSPPNYLYTFTLNCPKGTVNYFGPVFTTNSQNSLKNCRQQRTKYQSSISEYAISTSLYTQLINCNSQNTSCDVTMTFTSTQTSLIAFPYECLNAVYSISSFKLQKKIVTYIIVGIDFLISIFLIFFLCSQNDAENQEQDYFKQRQLSLSDFSIKVKGFTPKNIDKEFQHFIKSANKNIEPNFQTNIVQIKIPDNPKYIKQQQERKKKYEKLFEFMEREFFDNMIDPNVYQRYQDFISSNFNQMTDYLAFKNQMKTLLEQYRNSKKKIELFDDNQISIYLVMANAQEKRKLYRARTKNCCSQDNLVFGSLQFSLSEAPAPDLLQWDNKQKWTCCRVIFSWFITLIICFGSYVLFGFIQLKKNNLLSQYNFDVDCDLFYTTLDLQTWSSSLYASNNAQYTNCFCSEHYFTLNFNNNVTQYCSSWFSNYVSYLAIPILISVGLVLYNLIVSYLFKKLTQFEGFYLITDQLFSYTIKRAFMLIMNMGLIMILLNLNYSGSLNISQVSFLFTGKYNDMTADWYLEIATLIIMTLIFNIFFPFLELIMVSTLKCFRKCFDRRCWTKKTTTKYKSDYIDIYSGDVYPIQERYAILIAICWITMTFNCVIPFLNLICAFSLIIMEISDRVLIFKVFKKPLNYDQSLHKKFIKTVYLSYVIHTIATAFLISEPDLVAPNSTFSNTQSLTTSNQRLNIIIQTYYTLPYVALFILLVVYGFFKSTIIKCLSACLAKCNKTLNRVNRYKIQQDFFESLNEYQLNRLKLLTEKQMIRVQNSSRNKNVLLNANSRAISEDINVTQHQLFSASGDNSQMRILKRTYDKLKQHLKLIEKNNQEIKRAKLIGMPGYQVLCNDNAFNSQKKILLLDSVLEQIILLNSPRATYPPNSRVNK